MGKENKMDEITTELMSIYVTSSVSIRMKQRTRMSLITYAVNAEWASLFAIF